MSANNITPVFDKMLMQSDKEQLLSQHGACFWFTGLSGSGKSTLAIQLEQELHKKNYLVKLLDGDNIRTGLNNNLGFSEPDRNENIRRIAEVNKLFVETGIVTINSFISPTSKLREMAREIIGKNRFYLIYINSTLETCESRDVKGLYKKARNGQIPEFTGISAPFEKPENVFLEIDTTQKSIQECTNELLYNILPLIEYKK